MLSQHFSKYSFNVLCAFIFISCTIWNVESATTHKHVHGSKERLEDGTYSPRDAHHHNEDGEHNVEFDHEAILGSVKEAEEFDQLSPEESKKRLAVLVKKMDLNDDEFIDRHELKAWILRSFRQLSEEEANERFDDIDENKDDKVTWQEYLVDTYGMESEHEKRDPFQAPHADEESKLIADDRRMFDAADLNKDGVLNANEFIAFLSPEEFAHMLPIILEQTIRDKDTNGDGKIDFQEFIGDLAANHDKEWLISEKEKFDADYDHDGDGTLNGNEILSWVVPSNE